jgi:hypothetical protein
MKGDQDAAKLALVLPGRLDTKDYAHMVSAVDFLSARGYLAVSFIRLAHGKAQVVPRVQFLLNTCWIDQLMRALDENDQSIIDQE